MLPSPSRHLQRLSRSYNCRRIALNQRTNYSTKTPRYKRPMTADWSVTFLGTSSGGGPTETRNCSSLICNLLGNGTLWMVDCAEGTTRQLAHTRTRPRSISKIFVTHMHADHVMGLVPLLRNALSPPPLHSLGEMSPIERPSKVEIYGPAGIRTFVRTILNMTYSRSSDNYAVHELLTEEDERTSCSDDQRHPNENEGQDIQCSEDGLWRSITQGTGFYGEIQIDAGPISHRDPCIGYVFRETCWPGRKAVILGDTHDPSALIPLCLSPSPSLLVHEATDAHIPSTVDSRSNRLPEVVKERALARGHSTPAMAGEFARQIGAERLILNHIGARFPAPHNPRHFFGQVIREIERQATSAWGLGQAQAAWDLMHVVIPPPQGPPPKGPSADAAMTAEMEEVSVERTAPRRVGGMHRPHHGGHPYKGRRGGGGKGHYHKKTWD